MGSDPSRSGGEQLQHAWRGLCMLSGSSFLSGVGRRAVCAEPDLCKSHGRDRSSFISCSSHAPLHVHTSKRQHVHRHGAAERNLAIQSALSGDHLVASNGKETPPHGGRRPQESMGFAMSCKTEICDQKWRFRCILFINYTEGSKNEETTSQRHPLRHMGGFLLQGATPESGLR